MNFSNNFTDSYDDYLFYDVKDLNCIDSFINHRPEYTSQCGKMERFTFLVLYPPLFFLAMAGNTLNLCVFRVQSLDGAGPVAFLKFKCIANMVFTLGLLVEFLHAMMPSKGPLGGFEEFYWYHKRFVSFAVNTAGTMSTWCTLAITILTFCCVTLPTLFRKYWTLNKDRIHLVLMVMLSAGMHSMYTFILGVEKQPDKLEILESSDGTFCMGESFYFSLNVVDKSFVLNRIYFWTHSVLVIWIPLVLMCLFTVLLAQRYPIAVHSEIMSRRKRLVLRMTFTTTLAHVILEGPQLSVMLMAAFGVDTTHDELCITIVAMNFLSFLNSAVSFFLYFAWNHDFRAITIRGIKTCWRRPTANMSGWEPSMSITTNRRYATRLCLTETQLSNKQSPMLSHKLLGNVFNKENTTRKCSNVRTTPIRTYSQKNNGSINKALRKSCSDLQFRSGDIFL